MDDGGANDEDRCRTIEEQESLAEIYPDHFNALSSSEWRLDLTSNPRASATLMIPAGYPSKQAPTVVIDAPFVSDADITLLANRLADLHAESEGSEVAFEYFEYLREKLEVLAVADSTPIEPKEVEDVGVAAHEEVQDEQLPETWTFVPDSTRFKQPVRHLNPIEPSRNIEIVHGELIEDRKSKFEAHLAKVLSQQDVEWVHSQLLQNKRIAKASHNVVCYRYYDEETGALVHDNDDDGESGAGNRLAEMMHLMQANNVFIMVSRWYGGIHLGPDRFRHFNNCAQSLLAQCGFQRASSGKSKGKRK